MKLSKRIALLLAPLLLLGLGLFPLASSAATIERSVTCSPNTGAANVTMNVGDTLVISTTGCGGAGTGGANSGTWAYGINGTESAGAFPGDYVLNPGDKVSFVATNKNTANATGITLWTGPGVAGTVGPQILITVNDPTPPTLSSSTPTDNATGVSASSNIVLNFSESVKAGTGNILIKKSSDNTTITTIPIANAQITISGSTVTINPTADLDFDTGYYIEIASGVILDLSDNAFAGISGATTLNFTTAAETTPPTLSSSTPTDNATGVSASSNIVLNFSESVKAGTGNILIKKSSDNTTITTIPIANAQITISGSTVTINPTADLDFDTGYYIEIASGVILDLSDNAFAGISGATTLNFTTAAETTPPANVPSISQRQNLQSNYFVAEGFKRGKAELNQAMKRFIQKELTNQTGVKRVVCTGTVRGKIWTPRRDALAQARAKAGCDYVSTLSPHTPVELRKRLIPSGEGNPLTVRIRVIY